MEFLIRTPCPCRHAPVPDCQVCDGKQYVDRWMPFEMVKQYKHGVIVGRRFVGTPSTL